MSKPSAYTRHNRPLVPGTGSSARELVKGRRSFALRSRRILKPAAAFEVFKTHAHQQHEELEQALSMGARSRGLLAVSGRRQVGRKAVSRTKPPSERISELKAQCAQQQKMKVSPDRDNTRPESETIRRPQLKRPPLICAKSNTVSGQSGRRVARCAAPRGCRWCKRRQRRCSRHLIGRR